MTELNYDAVNKYWSAARPSILGPYMMDGFGFPATAGQFRFRAETRITQRLICGLNSDGTVLDLGSGIGYWAEHFAEHFAKVVAVEASTPLYDALRQRCESYSHVETVKGDVLLFEPKDRYELIFLGGLLMYLNENDAIALLRKLSRCLEPGGMIVCRESTVQQGVETRAGEYQVVYRSVTEYQRIFGECGLSVVDEKRNTPYVLVQMGCEFVKKWKARVPARVQMIPVVGHLVYWALRIGYPWITRVPSAFGVDYPKLSNHFFVLCPESQDSKQAGSTGSQQPVKNSVGENQ
jgi:SAM-dependent methyltransferase